MDGLIRKLEIPQKNQVTELDFFSEGVGITFGGHDRSRTKAGYIGTIFILACFGFLFQYNLNQMLDTSQPKIQFDVINDSSNNKYNSTNSDFKFFILFDDPSVTVVETVLPAGAVPEDPPLFSPEEALNNPDLLNDYLADNPGTDTSLFADYLAQGEALEEAEEEAAADEEERRLRRRRRLEASTIESTFLAYADLKKYFDVKVNFMQVSSKTVNGKRTQTKKLYTVPTVECSKADWFTKKEYDEKLNINKYARKLISSNGVCFAFEDEHTIYGNWLADQESSISIDISLCTKTAATPDCLITAFDTFRSRELYAYLGSFTAGVDNSKFDEPFQHDYLYHTALLLKPHMTNYVDMTYKRVKAKTDVGPLLEKFREEQIGIIENVIVQPVASISCDAGAVGNCKVPSNYLVAALDIRGSSQVNVYTRKYDKVFDFIGNVGGAMELVFLLATIFLMQWEEMVKAKRLKRICQKELGMTDWAKAAQKKRGRCGCLKKKTDLEEQVDTYTDQISEQSLSYEQLLQSALLSDVLKKTIVPREILLAAPLFLSIEKAKLDKEEEDKKQAASNKNKVAHAKVQDVPKDDEDEQEEEMTVAQALKNIMSPEFEVMNPAFANFKRKYLPLLTPEQLELVGLNSGKDKAPTSKNSPAGFDVEKEKLSKKFEVHKVSHEDDPFS
jgi:hypothetical protein